MRISPHIILLFLILSIPRAQADDAIERALQDLGAEEPGARATATKVLWAADGKAWQRASEVLATTTDAEVRARLTPIVDWLWIQLKSGRLEEVWKDRWFLAKSGGKLLGVEHQTAQLKAEGGDRTWIFVHETDEPDADGKLCHRSLELRTHHDPGLTPIDATWMSDGFLEWNRRFSWEHSRVRITSIGRGDAASFGPDYGGAFQELHPLQDGPFSVDVLVPELVERASLARVDLLELPVHFMLSGSGTESHAFRVEFAEVRPLKALGRVMEARVYIHGMDEAGPRTEYWISDTDGLLRVLLDGIEYDRVTEAEAKAAGLDPESRRMKEGASRVEKLLAAQGDKERNDAELRVLACAEALDPARKGLAVATDPDLRQRLERCIRWLDPEFAAGLLARLRDRRYFRLERDGKICGAEWISASPSPGAGLPGLSWSGEAAVAEGGAVTLDSWSVDTGNDPILSPRSAAFQSVNADGHVSFWRARWHDPGRWPVILEARGTDFDGGGGRIRGYRSSHPGANLPATCQVCLTHQVERASLARLPAIALACDEFTRDDPRSYRPWFVEFAGEVNLNIDGKEVRARHYVHKRSLGEGMQTDYWLSDEDGVVRITRDDCVLTAVSRDDWLKSGFDGNAARAKILERRLDALRGNDLEARALAAAQLASEPEGLQALRDALAREKSPPAAARIEAICRWLDPSFGREAMQAIGQPRWFEARRGGARIGWECVSTSAEPAGWRFQVKVHEPTGDTPMVPRETTFRTDLFAAGRRYEVEDRLDPVVRDARTRSILDRGTMTWVSVELNGGEPMEGAEPTRLGGSEGWPIVPRAILPRLLERASLARLDSLTVAAWWTSNFEYVSVCRYDLQSEEVLTVRGEQIPARRYARVPSRPENPDELWISDAAGVVRRVENGVEYLLSTEQELQEGPK